ncbi:motility associated factor glycosyltransferase family protein [Ornithinibacillus contaminans]|uniref:motility associated factor glycosyltransferase family protein n=1 Tax=Ornithinibacillus contaminans TaxID=694055 RepID=UPI00064DA9C9|nr:6-hydroxymethylpterin diphosphokinase MptE-like protein [Ornithinibacillus contaminans]
MLIDNTLLLREHFPQIRKYFLEYGKYLDCNNLEILNSKSGQKTIRYLIEDNKGIMVHSAYDPVHEAERIIAAHRDEIKKDTHVFFYGIGMGYHVERFKELFPNNSYSLYEPSPEIFYKMTQHKLLESIITKKIEHLYIHSHINESNEYLEEFNTNNKDIRLIVLPSYENIVKDKIQHFRTKITEAIRVRRAGLHTNVSFQKLWVINSLLNFKEVLETPNILRDIDHSQFAGKPAIIVSAGPSLAEDIEHIRYIKEKKLANIFSVGSAINSLISYDVLPDAVCTYDPGKMNHKVFELMIENNIDYIPMVFGSSVGYETLTNYQGPKVHFITSQDRSSIYFLREQLNIEQDIVMDSPSIAVMTFQILNKLGANPIIFAGQNLGYLYDRLYSEGIEYDHINSIVDKKKLGKALKTTDVYGNEIKTNIGFNNMRESIEQLTKIFKGTTFINTTKGGAEIEGVPFQPIEDVIKNTINQPIKKNDLWWKSHNSYSKTEMDNKMEELYKAMDKYNNIISKFDALCDSFGDHNKLRNQLKVGELLIQFNSLYNQLNQNIYYKNFLSFYIRVQVQYVANEVKRLNSEIDSVYVINEVLKFLPNFLQQCKQGNKELEQFIRHSQKNTGAKE